LLKKVLYTKGVNLKKWPHLIVTFSKKTTLVNLDFIRSNTKMPVALHRDSQKRRTSNRAQTLWTSLVIAVVAISAVDYIQGQNKLENSGAESLSTPQSAEKRSPNPWSTGEISQPVGQAKSFSGSLFPSSLRHN
jgi:hypothetical protein